MTPRLQTGPLPDFDRVDPLTPHTLQSAWMYLDDMCSSGSVNHETMVRHVALQYGLTREQAEGVVKKWERMK